MIYLITLIYIIYLNFTFSKQNRAWLPSYWFVYLILVLLAGFRYNLGNDTFAYTQEFKTFPTLFELNYNFITGSNYQILWIIFESSIRTITDSFYFLQFILAAFVNYAVFKYIKLHSQNPFLTILFYYILFFLNLNMEILRESVSISLLLISLKYIENKQYLKYYIIATIAFFFHYSGGLLFLIPLFLKLKIERKGYLISTIALLSLSGFISIYLANFIDSFNLLYAFSKSGYFDALGTTGTTINTQILLFIKYIAIPCLVFLLFYKYFEENEKKFVFLYIVFSILYLQIFIFYRIRDYFYIFLIVSLTNGLILKYNNKLHNLFIKGFLMGIFLYISLFRVYYSSNNNGVQLYLHYYPYNSILNEEIPQARVINFAKVGGVRN
jgi:hypothetical protein